MRCYSAGLRKMNEIKLECDFEGLILMELRHLQCLGDLTTTPLVKMYN